MKQVTLLTILTALSAVMICFSANATTHVHRVNNNAAYNQFVGDTVFSDLNMAIGSPSVLPGDTLYVEASGTSYGIVTINKSLTLIGTGYFLNENIGLQQNQIASTVDRITFAAGSSGSTIMGLRVTNTSANAIVYLSNSTLSNITITRCYIEDRIEFQNTGTTALNNIVITKNFDDGGIQVASVSPGPITGLIVTNNNFGDNVKFVANQSGTLAQNVFHNGVNIHSSIGNFYNNIIRAGTFDQNDNSPTNVFSNLFVIPQPAWLIGGNIAFGEPMGTIFSSTGTTDGILSLNDSITCPHCYQGYPGNEEVGIFGGSDPYVLSGIPSIPSIYLLQAPPNGAAGDTINTNISTRSND